MPLDDQKPLPASLADLAVPPAKQAPLLPIKLPRFTFITGCTDAEAEAIAGALTAQDNSLYLESFRQPIFDAVDALLNNTGFTALRDTPEWDLEAYPGGPTPSDLANRLENGLSTYDIVSFEKLAAMRVKENEGFNAYQYVFPDATGFNIRTFLNAVESNDALALVCDLQIQQPPEVSLHYVVNPADPVDVVARLRTHLGTL